MAWLRKGNSTATRKSVLLWAIMGALTVPLLVAAKVALIPYPYNIVALIAAGVCGAAIAALVQWQVC